MQVDLVVYGASQVVTCAAPGGVKRGTALADVGIVADGAVAVSDGLIVAVGPSAEVRAVYSGREEIDVAGKVLCPGFVDGHTHLVFAGQRIDEFERKLAGAGYMEILQAGGGILSTMRATRAASRSQLVALTHERLCELARLGTTTVEIKTGYGLDTASELKLLDAIADAAVDAPCTVVPTFLGAHAVPPPYAEQGQRGREAYVELVVEEMLPAVAAWRAGSPWAAGPFFCDVFCEPGAFDYAQTEQILRTAQGYGLGIKLHADQFVSLGGVRLAVELGATSVDHLEATPPADCALLGQAATATVAVVLPAVNFHLGSTHFADARGLIAAGAALALATDANPGSAPCLSLPFVMGLACRYQKLTPAEALNAATINAAYALGLADRVGSIEVGKQADLVIVAGEDYRGLVYWMGRNLVAGVVQRGRVIA